MMKKLIFSTILLCFWISPLLAQYAKVEEVSIESKELDQTREIMIYTPFGFDQSPYKLYNVIYVFDAQNRRFFDFTTSLSQLWKSDSRGLIVVGIKATFIEEKMYARNHDLLPSDTQWNLGPKSGGNAEAFLAYVKNEVVPYVESHYSILPGRTAIGHSLSASFLLYSLLNEPDLFDNYVAVSPNLRYDKQRLVRGLRAFDPARLNSTKYLYMSHADEGEAWRWKEANEAAYALLQDTLASEKFKVQLEQYPQENHGSGFIPSIMSAMGSYMDSIRPALNSRLSQETYEVTFRVKALEEDDELYISGNQESLGNWEKDQIKMRRISPLEREITLKVHDYVEVLIYIDGASRAWFKCGEQCRSNFPMMIRPEEGAEYTFELDRNQ